jgi:hypothetical protein
MISVKLIIVALSSPAQSGFLGITPPARIKKAIAGKGFPLYHIRGELNYSPALEVP